MMRIDLIRHLEKLGCELFREGGSHAVYIPRHCDINDFLACKICRDLEVAEP